MLKPILVQHKRYCTGIKFLQEVLYEESSCSQIGLWGKVQGHWYMYFSHITHFNINMIESPVKCKGHMGTDLTFDPLKGQKLIFGIKT